MAFFKWILIQFIIDRCVKEEPDSRLVFQMPFWTIHHGFDLFAIILMD